MKTWILDLWLQVRASYWFLPTLMAIAAVSGAAIAVHFDVRLGDDWLDRVPWLHATRPAGARALLSTVAGSMITVAGVTFSMTLLAVSHASAQIGPRLLSGFMRDRGNQFTLGTFIATFLYCLMVLRSVRDGDEASGTFVPDLAILIALLLTLLSVMVLIYFIHHVPQSINIGQVVARIGDELLRCIDRLYPGGIGATRPDPPPQLPAGFDEQATEVLVEGKGGYMRVLDGKSLLDVLCRADMLVRLEQRPGDFAIPGHVLMKAWPPHQVDDEVCEDLRSAITWGSQRTRDQDVRVPIEQLLEILGKAMSPGVNGQYTAILCIDQFERALAQLLSRPLPSAWRYDQQGTLRIVATPVTHEELVAAILGPMRQFVRDDWVTTRHVLRMLKRLVELPRVTHARPVLEAEIAVLRSEIEAGKMSPAEKCDALAH